MYKIIVLLCLLLSTIVFNGVANANDTTFLSNKKIIANCNLTTIVENSLENLYTETVLLHSSGMAITDDYDTSFGIVRFWGDNSDKSWSITITYRNNLNDPSITCILSSGYGFVLENSN